MSLVLIDTSVWARQNQPHVRQAVAEAIEANAVAMVVPVMLELLRSARDHAELLELAEEYEALHLIPLKPDLGKRARAYSTLERWVYLARRAGHGDTIKALRRRVRKDAGTRRAISTALVQQHRDTRPGVTSTPITSSRSPSSTPRSAGTHRAT